VNKNDLDLIGDLLTSLELAEVKLMEWGFFDVSHTDEELVKLFEEHPTRGDEFCQLVSGTSPTMFVDDMATAGLLYRIKTGDPSLFRSRFAESIRLMVRLKQRFKPGDWDTAPELVSDARFHLNPRRFPVRDISFEKVFEIDILARKHGIKLSNITGHLAEITDEEIELCRKHALKKLNADTIYITGK
jgi:hypothetical protein